MRDGWKTLARLVCTGAAALGLTAPAHAADMSAFVLLGDGGAPIARVITSDARCPSLTIDGRRLAMRPRAAPATLPLRPTLSTPENSKPSAFLVSVCEAAIPRHTRRASVEGRRLALPPALIKRIVVIGDTGCRLKASDHAYQDCNDPRAYPFATVAARAAAWKPDLVIHVGDYLYRENPCPADHPGCDGSPWGYGWDAWQADFFRPGAPLLKAAPWVLVRGNHENCARAGQGWWRMIDPWPLQARRDCIDAANDTEGDFSPPYAVKLGGGAQVVVLDLAIAGSKPTPDGDPRVAEFRGAYRALDRFSRRARFTFMATHKPILGFGANEKDGKVELFGGTPGIGSVFAAQNPDLLPAGVDVLLAGHIHLWEQVSFSSSHPSQFIAGFSGTQEDIVPLPAKLPPGVTPAAGAVVDHFSSWIDGFGYMTLQRLGPQTWAVTVWNLAGKPVNHCRIEGRRSSCDKPQVTSQ